MRTSSELEFPMHADLASVLSRMHLARGATSVNLARIDFVALRLAAICAEVGSLSAATRLAHMSISAGSRKLELLEAALGVRLFERRGRRLKATASGKLVAVRAQEVTDRLMTMVAEARQLQLPEPLDVKANGY